MENNIELFYQNSNESNSLLKESIIHSENDQHKYSENETLFVNECYKSNDEILKLIYQYYYYGGYSGLLFNMIKDTFIHLFIIIFSLFLMTMIDWGNILKCKNCNISDYLHNNPYEHDIFFNLFTTFFGLFYFTKWIFDVFYDVRKYFKVQSVRHVFHDKLEIRDNLLKDMKWNDILNNLIELHNTKKYKLFDHDDQITSYEINSCVSRYDNYLIAMINNDLLSHKIGCSNVNYLLPEVIDFYLRIIDWSYLNNCRLNYTFINNDHRVKLVSKIIGFKYIFFVPFKILYYVFSFVFLHAEDLNSKRNDTDISKYEWSLYSKWKFKDYNEMDHLFDRRIFISYKYANMYIQQRNTPISNAINNIFLYISKGLLSFIIIISFLNDELLLELNIFNKNLLWYLAVLTFIITTTKKIIIDPKTLIYSSEKIIKNLAVYIHYFPDKWKRNCHRSFVRREFNNLYLSKFYIFFYDFINIFWLPYIFLVKIPNQIPIILQFIRDNSEYVPNIGNICKLSHFENKPTIVDRNDKMSHSIINHEINFPEYTMKHSMKHSMKNNITNFESKDIISSESTELEKCLYQFQNR